MMLNDEVIRYFFFLRASHMMFFAYPSNIMSFTIVRKITLLRHCANVIGVK